MLNAQTYAARCAGSETLIAGRHCMDNIGFFSFVFCQKGELLPVHQECSSSKDTLVKLMRITFPFLS